MQTNISLNRESGDSQLCDLLSLEITITQAMTHKELIEELEKAVQDIKAMKTV